MSASEADMDLRRSIGRKAHDGRVLGEVPGARAFARNSVLAGPTTALEVRESTARQRPRSRTAKRAAQQRGRRGVARSVAPSGTARLGTPCATAGGRVGSEGP